MPDFEIFITLEDLIGTACLIIMLIGMAIYSVYWWFTEGRKL